jgi:hypothetical protein
VIKFGGRCPTGVGKKVGLADPFSPDSHTTSSFELEPIVGLFGRFSSGSLQSMSKQIVAPSTTKVKAKSTP